MHDIVGKYLLLQQNITNVPLVRHRAETKLLPHLKTPFQWIHVTFVSLLSRLFHFENEQRCLQSFDYNCASHPIIEVPIEDALTFAPHEHISAHDYQYSGRHLLDGLQICSYNISSLKRDSRTPVRRHFGVCKKREIQSQLIWSPPQRPASYGRCSFVELKPRINQSNFNSWRHFCAAQQ